jgi:hypothetical protein
MTRNMEPLSAWTYPERSEFWQAVLDNNYGSWGRKWRVSEIRVSILSYLATRTEP